MNASISTTAGLTVAHTRLNFAPMYEASELKYRVRNALGWAAGTRFIAQAANWALTLATIRFVHPEEYGLMAMTMSILGLVQAFGYGGFADVVIQSRELSEAHLRSLYGMILLINAACLAALYILAYPAALFYEQPRVIPLIQTSSLIFILIAFQTIPRAMLEKRLDLKTVSRAELISGVAAGVLVLALAAAGAGAWALVAGFLFGSCCRLVLFFHASPFFCLPRFAFREISGLLRSGGLRISENVLGSFFSTSDLFIVGKVLGTEALGIYSVARDIAALPGDKLARVIRPIAFPAFAQVQYDPTMATTYLRKAVRLLAFVTFPIFFGISAISPQITDVILGQKWHDAALPLAVLALGMVLRPIGFLVPSFLIGTGQFAASFKNVVFASVLLPTAFLIGSHWGLLGVCIAWVIAYPVNLVNLFRRVSRITNTSLTSLMLPLLSPMVGSLVMYGAVQMTRIALPTGIGPTSSLVLLIITGGAAYFAYSLVFLKPIFGEFLSLVRR
jgi:teichuronic acid exporter